MAETIKIVEQKTNLIVSTPSPQGPRGKTILNGNGVPSNNLGLEGDFYYDKETTRFYGPKPTDLTWSGATNYLLSTSTLTFPFSLNQVLKYPANAVGNAIEYWYVEIQHNMGYNPNVTVKASSGDILETGIDYNNTNKITLTMAQPFSGTAYLS